MTWPSIDHSGLSPSGRCSKRARKAWLKVQAARLFPAGTFSTEPATPPTSTFSTKPAPADRAVLLASAKRLRDLAALGMSPRKFRREADRLEAEAARIGGAT